MCLHRRLHNEEKGSACEFCGKHFQDSMRLRMHMLSHTGTLQPPHSFNLEGSSGGLHEVLLHAPAPPPPSTPLHQPTRVGTAAPDI